MNKKVMALAVAGVLSAPALALAQVTVGGGITILFYSHDPDNSTGGQRSDIMQSSESEVNIRGEEKLGGGMSAWFQCATSADGIVGGTTQTARVMCTRNSAFGFRGDFGNIFLGNWDTPTKLVQNRVRGWFSGTNALVGGGYVLLGGDSSSGAANTGTSFYRRQANSVNYHSPNWGGFSVAAVMSAANETVVLPETSTLTPRLMGINGVYAAGPLWVGVAYEQHADYSPGGAVAAGSGASQYSGGTDDNVTLGVGYTFARVFNIRGTYSQSNYETTNAGTLEVKGYGVYGDWNIQGPHTIRAAYITVDDVKGNTSLPVGVYSAPLTATGAARTSTGGDVITLAYSYNFSKRTEIYFAYNQMKNDTNAAFNQGVTSVTLGGKQTSMGIGLKHSF